MDSVQAQAFRQLKPVCVAASQAALKFKGAQISPTELVNTFDSLRKVLQNQTNNGTSLDAKLADYAFFPLSHIFREAQNVPVKALEIAVQCTNLLILHGWRRQITQEMSKQLLTLLSFIAGESPVEPNVKQVREELASAAFECLQALFQCSSNAGLGEENMVLHESMPQLGYITTVLLDGVAHGPSPHVQQSAAAALLQMLESMSDVEALRNILPGIVSAITKLLSIKATGKPSSKLIVESLRILNIIFGKTLKDEIIAQSDDKKLASWVTATGSQVKLALANVVPLKNSDRAEVKIVLADLCFTILGDCRESLDTSLSMVIETLLDLCVSTGDRDMISKLSGSLSQSIELLELLKSCVHGLIQSLPRIMQSHEEARKELVVGHISLAFRVFQENNSSIEILSNLLANTTNMTLASAVELSPQPQILPASADVTDVAVALRNPRGGSSSFQPILLNNSGQSNSLTAFSGLAKQLQNWMGVGMSTEMIGNTIRSANGKEQVAALWIALQMLKRTDEFEEAGDFIDLSLFEDPMVNFRDETYSFALSILSDSSPAGNEASWQLQALSLEAVVIQARHQKEAFRPELVDALYPILERLSSPLAQLQQHAITALNMVSEASRYYSPAAMIIENADYLVNAISLKFNMFDIVPQAPQIMVMMLRLCGPPLIPYLDDLVDAMFSILSSFHGYTQLVELIFEVFDVIVGEASESKVPLIENERDTTTRPKPYVPMTIEEAMDDLQRRKEKHEATELADQEAEAITTELEDDPPMEELPTTEDVDPEAALPPAEPPAPKPSKTFSLIRSITSLAPAHLTSPSPIVRTRILSLLTKSFPLLAVDTDIFLPIAAQLYPYITARLFPASSAVPSSKSSSSLILTSSSSSNQQGPLPYETIAAASALSSLCAAAGDFLASRIQDDWPKIAKVYWRTEKEMMEDIRSINPYLSSPKPNRNPVQAKLRTAGSTRWRVWDHLVSLLISILVNVGLPPSPSPDPGSTMDAEGELFEMLAPYVGGEWPISSHRFLNTNSLPNRTISKTAGPEEWKREHERRLRAQADTARTFMRQHWEAAMSEERKDDVRGALEGVNADWLWLWLERGRVQRGGEPVAKPVREGWEFTDIIY